MIFKEHSCLSHGGPGSGRYPKGSGEHSKYRTYPKQRRYSNNYNNNQHNNKHKKDNTLKTMQNITNSGDKIYRGTKDISDRIIETRKKNRSMKINLSDMSNKDLSNAIRRLSLERDYRSMTAGDLTKGEKLTKTIISGLGSTLNIAAGGLGVLYGLKKLGLI